MGRMWSTLCLALLGCGVSEDWPPSLSEEFCNASNVCLEAEGLEPVDCSATLEDDDGDAVEFECDYDANKATQCLDELDVAGCDGPRLILPTVCDEVFTNCEEA